MPSHIRARVAAVATFPRDSTWDQGDDMKKLRWIRFASIGFCLSIALALGCAPSASAQQDSDQPPSDNPQCTDENLQGRYGYIVSGWLVGLVPVASVGVVTFDGDGILNVQDTFNNSVAISRRTGAGSYTVNPNCTGSASIDLTSDAPIDLEHLEFNFMIVPGT